MKGREVDDLAVLAEGGLEQVLDGIVGRALNKDHAQHQQSVARLGLVHEVDLQRERLAVDVVLRRRVEVRLHQVVRVAVVIDRRAEFCADTGRALEQEVVARGGVLDDALREVDFRLEPVGLVELIWTSIGD